jgi:hypothetical protein
MMANVIAFHNYREVRSYQHRSLRFATVLLLCGPFCLLCTSAQTVEPIASVSQSRMSTAVTAENLAPTEPTIVYENGLLTINATNSTLGDILREICTKTGGCN